MISGTDAFGKSMRDQCMTVTRQVRHRGGAARKPTAPRDSDMTPQLTNIKGKAGVQAVINAGFGQGPAIVTRNYRQLGITAPLYQSHGVGSKQFIELAGAAPPKACGCRRPRCWSPKSCPTAIRRRRSWSTTRRPTRSQDRPAGLDLRRPHV